MNFGSNAISNQWATFLLRTVVRTGPHPIVSFIFLDIDFKMILYRFLLIGGFYFAVILCFVPDNIGVMKFEISLYKSAFLSTCTKRNSCTDTASSLVSFSFSLLSNPILLIAINQLPLLQYDQELMVFFLFQYSPKYTYLFDLAAYPC